MTARFRAAVGVGLAVLGLVLTGTAVDHLLTVRTLPRPFGSVGDAVVAAGGGSAAPSADPSQPATADPAPSAAAATPAPTPPLGDPVRLRIPVQRVDAPVRAVASVGGSLPVPDNPGEVGWWTSSARPGSPSGTVVIDGHVDSATYGPGALFNLSRLTAGDSVLLVTTQTTVAYRVTALRLYDKSAGLPAGLFQPTARPELLLVSCGGPFDKTTRSYRDNVILTAVPSAVSP